MPEAGIEQGAEPILHGGIRFGVGLAQKGVGFGVAQRGVMVGVKEMRADDLREMGKGGHVVERGGNFRRAPEAVPFHACDPAGIGGAGMDDAGDLLGQGAGAGTLGIGVVEMIERGPTAGHRLRGGEPGLVRGIVGSE